MKSHTPSPCPFLASCLSCLPAFRLVSRPPCLPARSPALLRALLLSCAIVGAWAPGARADTYRPSRAGFLTELLFLGPIPAPDAARSGPDAALARPHLDPSALGEVAAGEVVSIDGALVSPGRQRHGPPPALGLSWEPLGAGGPSIELPAAGGDHQLGYLYGELVTDRPFRGWLMLGADDRIVGWLDGDPMPLAPVGGELVTDHQWVPLDLAPGRHRLLLKVYNEGGRWAVVLRLADTSFHTPVGVRVDLPGVAFGVGDVLGRMQLDLDREVDEDGGLRLVARIDLPGALPDVSRLVCAELEAGEAPSPRCLPVEAWAAAPHRIEAPGPAWEEATETAVRVWAPSAGPGSERRDTFALRPVGEAARALADARIWLAGVGPDLPAPGRPDPGSIDSLAYEAERLGDLIRRGDPDDAYVTGLGRALADLTQAFRDGRDPYAERRGAYLRAYRSDIDGRLQPYAIFVPPSYEPDHPLPLVVSLHGLRSPILLNLRQVLGFDRDEDQPVEDAVRHYPPDLDDPPAIFVCPYGYGDMVFRFSGEADILNVMGEVGSRFAIDTTRQYLTGLSMGGIGAFDFGTHYADRFAGVLALAGMADMHLYNEIHGYPLYPWEGRLVDEYSAVSWALNARNTPIYAIHGTEDPTDERHSQVMVDRLNALGYVTGIETPPLSHNVWRTSYAAGGLLARLGSLRRAPFPDAVSMTTASYRYATQDWVHIDVLAHLHEFGDVEAAFSRHRGRRALEVSVHGVDAFSLALDEAPAAWRSGPLSVRVDGQEVCTDDCWQALHLTRDGDRRWQRADAPPDRSGHKREGLEGPVQDALYGPLLIAYGTQDPAWTPLLRRLAEGLSGMRERADIHVPVLTDTEVPPELAASHNLILVGTPETNSLLAGLDDYLPIHADAEGVRVGSERIDGTNLTAIFIVPNPDAPDRYVVVYTGTSPLGLDGIRFAPRYLPDFVVYDPRARTVPNLRTFRERPVLAGGFFADDWSLPPPEQWMEPRARR